VNIIAFRLFVRSGATASRNAEAALKEYLNDLPKIAYTLAVVDLTDKPGVAETIPIVIVPTLAVNQNGSTKLLITGLSPCAVLKDTLSKCLSGDGEPS
jgi:hypothetical protein